MNAGIELFFENHYVRGGAYFVAAIVAAYLADQISTRVLLRLALKTKTEVDDKIVRILHRPIHWTFLLIGFSLAFAQFGFGETATTLFRRLAKTMGVFLWALAAVGIIRILLETAGRGRGPNRLVQPRTQPLFENLAFVLVFGAAIYFVLVSWHVDITGWVASAGIAGVALGFAAKDTLANLFSGIFIIVDSPYKLGDFIILDTGERGRVTDIGLRSTRILTRDDIEITVPNAVMGNSKIVNETGGPYDKERVRVRVGVAYDSDIDKVREVLTNAALEEEHVCESPEPRVRFREFGDSALVFELLAWIDEPVLRGRVVDRLNCRVIREFRSAGIEIPYPKRDLYIREMPPN